MMGGACRTHGGKLYTRFWLKISWEENRRTTSRFEDNNETGENNWKYQDEVGLTLLF
jgi:hypothetical protein